MAKMNIEGAAPVNVRNHALTNSKGKSMSNAAPTAPNKRGVDMSVEMKDSRNMARMPRVSAPIK